MRAILHRGTFDQANAPPSLRNLWRRFQDIERLFPADLQGQALPYFVDWLLERVMVVEIATGDPDLALEIFETMNDRGLRLSMTDMLKGYLLSRIGRSQDVDAANDLWRRRLGDLEADRNADADFFKHWLRAKYADTIRERRKDAVPGDFDVIGTAFNKWVRDHDGEIGLRKPGGVQTFVHRDFERLSRRYLHLLEVSQTFTSGFESVFYNACTDFTLQYQTILAAVTPVDDDDVFRLKTRMVAGYLDRLVALRMTNFRNFGYSTVSYTMFNLAKEIRDLEVDELELALGERCADEGTFEGVLRYGLHQRNGWHVRYILARLAAYIDAQCGTGLPFDLYISRDRANPFEVEHVWANRYERHRDAFATEEEFLRARDLLGDLLLLPKDFNRSYGDKTYEQKLPHYFGQNLLARSLHPQCYENNPSFLKFRDRHALPFRPYPQGFTLADAGERQDLYRRLCELVWSPEAMGLVVPEPLPAGAARGTREFGVTIGDLVSAGLLPVGTRLVGRHAGTTHRAVVTDDRRLRLHGGELFDTPSGAAMAVLQRSSWNGWAWWQAELPDGLRPLSRLREKLLECRGTGSLVGKSNTQTDSDP